MSACGAVPLTGRQIAPILPTAPARSFYYYILLLQYDGRMEDCGLFGAARTGTAPLHAVPARAWAEAAACRKDGGAVVTRMCAGSTSLLMLPAWLLRKMDAEALAKLLDDGGAEAADVGASSPPPPPAARAPSPKQLARRARRKRQRARKRAATDDGDARASGALPADDSKDGGKSDAPQARSSALHHAAAVAGRATRATVAARNGLAEANYPSVFTTKARSVRCCAKVHSLVRT